MLIDFGRVVFHAFTGEGRLYYDLEGQWKDAQRAYADKGWSYEQYLRNKAYNYGTAEGDKDK
jgi:hypothetical protein